jgi:hypothetical protein
MIPALARPSPSATTRKKYYEEIGIKRSGEIHLHSRGTMCRLAKEPLETPLLLSA